MKTLDRDMGVTGGRRVRHLHDAVLKRRGIIVEKKQNLAAGRESSAPRGGGSSGSSLKGLTAKKSWRQERRNSKSK